MAKLIAIASVLASLGCGAGSNDVAPFRREAPPAAVILGPCTNTPEDCGFKVCIDCTGGGPPGTEAACIRGQCAYPCAFGFHPCAAECVPDSDAGACGRSCKPCSAPPHGSAICTAGSCNFECESGFAKSASGCVSQSFSSSY